MPTKQIRLKFQTNLISEPVIYQLGHKFKVITNIKRANVRQDTGWVILDLNGDDKEISASLEWIKSVGVDVDVIK
ncbi:MAG: FeS-binding protein [SAR202 cluster bacterium]|nr:FeS-binding protein [SAR202 cluster bacterium]|tara:strand:- start:321 stop:545 length:225 start_codon:yes stop_codon:yes gene_type:complete